MKQIDIDLRDNSYSIYIENNILDNLGKYLKVNFSNSKLAIITDSNLNRFYGEKINQSLTKEGFNVDIFEVKPGEDSKSIEILLPLYEFLSNAKINRGDLILTLGGGVVGDLGGFVASTYLRGVPYIQLPTSLLAQVDSSIGGKVAVNLPWGKNLVGSFYHPKAVFIDPALLKTLDIRFLHDGLGEVIKYGFIKDINIINNLVSFENDIQLLNNIEEIIYMCCNIKKTIVEADEKDFGERMILNFGHTIGHAIEKYYDYKKYTHGEAVGIGMVYITRRSEELGITEKGTAILIEELLKKYNLPYELNDVDLFDFLKTIELDKKNTGKEINLILLKKKGEGFIKKIEFKDIENYIG
jgi:3-dehydroquinate synthase